MSDWRVGVVREQALLDRHAVVLLRLQGAEASASLRSPPEHNVATCFAGDYVAPPSHARGGATSAEGRR